MSPSDMSGPLSHCHSVNDSMAVVVMLATAVVNTGSGAPLHSAAPREGSEVTAAALHYCHYSLEVGLRLRRSARKKVVSEE